MSSNFNLEVGERIKIARKRKRLSMKKLGELVNLHESTVSRYEKGEILSLDIETLKEFAKALEVPPSYLMGIDDKDSIEQTTRHFNIWYEVAGTDELTDEEVKEIALYAKFIISERK